MKPVDNVLGINTWHHVVATWDGSALASGMHIYVNGKEVSYQFTQNAGGSRTDDDYSAITIGGPEDGYWDGLIDDVRVYNYTLTPTQIKTLYNENSAVRFGPLTGSP